MKKILKIIGIIFLLIFLYLVYISATTGFFRSIENSVTGHIQKIEVPGAEDFAISREDGFMFISSDDRAARRDGDSFTSGLYLMDVNTNVYEPQFIKAENDVELYPHGISMIKVDSGVYRLLVVNHVTTSEEAVSSMDIHANHSIEEYRWMDGQLTHIKTHADELMNSPNDVVAIDDTRFYFTNDHGSKTKLGLLSEDYLGFKRSNVVYFDGRNYKMVDDGIAYANGINYDSDKNVMYVASPRDFLVKAYTVSEDGTLDFQTDIDCNSGVDNIELDENGKVWIGSHPKLLLFTAYAAGSRKFAPSEIITIEYNSKDDYQVESVFEGDGSEMSASTTVIPYNGKVFVGNVMDKHFIVLNQSQLEK